ncbi:AtpZ/AtpI family protein [Dyadobacter luticola]|uniref:AtpZ/AtpI family protein n=1 Tax=Dyadobacter luticola TaxID=1979387 RepID=A0A5R9KYJ9_9BACT|nr:AtpZ/AtpI family protein [Dyadobacter luticola]TLV01160.1 AtpZ/AtpI family protein [Dyadobacter luticola]
MKKDKKELGYGNEGGQQKKVSSGFLKYSGLATQMLGTILVFTYLGYRLDGWQQNKVPWWTLVLSLASIAASLFLLIKSFTKR